MRALYAPADVRVKLLVFCAKMGSSERVKSLQARSSNKSRPLKGDLFVSSLNCSFRRLGTFFVYLAHKHKKNVIIGAESSKMEGK